MKNIDYVKTLMDKGADVNAKSGAKITGCLTPLMICAQVNFTEGINLLLSNEFTKFDQQDIKGRTALHIACIYDNTDSIKLLSDRIDNNIKDINGKKAFDYLD